MRSGLAAAVWLLAGLAALVLALGSLVVALRLGSEGEMFSAAVTAARDVDLGVLPVFTGPDAALRDALASWAAAALVYLLVGTLVARLLRRRDRHVPGRSL